jgi:hypothetical protein
VIWDENMAWVGKRQITLTLDFYEFIYYTNRDGIFILKALLNARRNHDLATYVGFVDLVKAYDTANHTLLLCILERYGAPPKFVAAIQTIHTNNFCMLKIEK